MPPAHPRAEWRLGAEVRVCLRRRSVRTLMRPCESCSFGGNDTMCRMPSAMPPDRRTAHLCFCPSRCRLEEQSVISGVAHGPGRGCPLRHQPGVSASPPGLRSTTLSPWRLGACPGRAAPTLWLLELPPSASVEGRMSQASSSSVSPRPAGAPLDRGRAGRGTSRASSAQWLSARVALPLAGPDLPTSAARLAALAFSSGSGVRLHAGHGAQSRHF